MSVNTIVSLVEYLLLERRVIISATKPGVLTSTVNALHALLNPFIWHVSSPWRDTLNLNQRQHVFIPILPKSMLDYCSAPMPFFIGILASSQPTVQKLPLEEVGKHSNCMEHQPD